jgi:hypothetical protein
MLKGNGRSRSDVLAFSIVGVDGNTPYTYAVTNDRRHGSDKFFASYIAGFYGFRCRIHSTYVAGSEVVPIPGSVLLLSSGV